MIIILYSSIQYSVDNKSIPQNYIEYVINRIMKMIINTVTVTVTVAVIVMVTDTVMLVLMFGVGSVYDDAL